MGDSSEVNGVHATSAQPLLYGGETATKGIQHRIRVSQSATGQIGFDHVIRIKKPTQRGDSGSASLQESSEFLQVDQDKAVDFGTEVEVGETQRLGPEEMVFEDPAADAGEPICALRPEEHELSSVDRKADLLEQLTSCRLGGRLTSADVSASQDVDTASKRVARAASPLTDRAADRLARALDESRAPDALDGAAAAARLAQLTAAAAV